MGQEAELRNVAFASCAQPRGTPVSQDGCYLFDPSAFWTDEDVETELAIPDLLC